MSLLGTAFIIAILVGIFVWLLAACLHVANGGRRHLEARGPSIGLSAVEGRKPASAARRRREVARDTPAAVRPSADREPEKRRA